MKENIKYLILASISLNVCACSSKQQTEYCSFNFEGINCTCESKNQYVKGSSVELTIVPDEDYYLPDTIEFSGDTYTYSKDNGTLSFVIADDISVKCEALYSVTTYFLTKEYFDGDLSYEWNVTKENQRTQISFTNVNVCHNEFVYEGDNLIFSKEEYDESYEYPIIYTEYTYSNDLLVKKEWYTNENDERVTVCAEFYEYDELNRLVTITENDYEYGSIELTKYFYPNEFKTIITCYNSLDDTTLPMGQKIIEIDIEKGIKTYSEIDVVDSEIAFERYVEIYDLETGKILETFEESSYHNVFSYDENGNPLSRICYRFNSSTDEWNPTAELSLEYGDNGILNCRTYSKYNADSGDFVPSSKTFYESDENNIVVKSTAYDIVDNYELELSYTYEYEYTSVNYKIDTENLHLCIMPNHYTSDLLFL